MIIYEIISTFFFSGKASKAPGTFGTIASIPLVIFVQFYLPNRFQFFRENYTTITSLIIIFIFIIGTISAHIYANHISIKDPKQVVIDEVVGMMLTVFIVQIYLKSSFLIDKKSLKILLISFILFRFFDIIKPYPISLIDRKLTGGLGIMLDDVLAAIFAGIATIISLRIF
jgi:phosphatidylglycerophosphatase A